MNLVGVKISGLHNVNKEKTYLFSNLTYLYGPNGAGKSTIFQAIQWGLLGYIPGTNKTNSAIFSHANKNKIRVEVRLYGTNDDEIDEVIIVRSLEKLGNKFEENLFIHPETLTIDEIVGNLELPILNFNEFLNLTANKQKDLLISILPSNENQIDTRECLTNLSEYDSECVELLDEIYTKYPVLCNINDIKSLNQYLKDLQSNLNSEEKRITSTIQSMIFYDDYEGLEDVDELQSQIIELTSLRDEVLTSELQISSYEEKLKSLEEYEDLYDVIENDKNYQNLMLEIEECENKCKNFLEEKLNLESNKNYTEYEFNQQVKILNSGGICPFIETDCDEIRSRLTSVELKNKDLQDELNKISAQLSENLYNQQLLSKKRLEIQEKIDNLRNKYINRDNLRKILDEKPKSFDITSQELALKLQNLNEDLIKASSNKKYKELVDVIQKQKFQLISQIAFVKSAIKATGENGLQSQIMSKPFLKMSQYMEEICLNLNLQELGKPEFILEEKANSFKFGFTRDKFISFELLSSGEKCIFTLIFMLSLIHISNSMLSFIMIDDLFDHLDDFRFKTVINNVNKFSKDHQILIAGVKEIPSNLSFEELSIIKVGENND